MRSTRTTPLLVALAVVACGAGNAEVPLHGIGSSEEVAHAPASAQETDAGAPAEVAQAPAGDASVPEYVVAASQGRVVPPAVEDVETMCALLTSCPSLAVPAPAETLRSVPGCVQSMMGQLASPDGVKFSLLLRECGLHAKSCDELRTCALRGVSPDTCAGHGRDGRVGWCDASGRAVSCSYEKVIGVRECARSGEECVQVGDDATCVLGRKTECTEDEAQNEENALKGNPKRGPVTWCSPSGNRAIQCDHGRLGSEDCSAFGLACATVDGKAGCATTSAACAGKAARCEGNVAIGCMQGHQVRVDCGAAGLACEKRRSGAGAVGACVAHGGGCRAGERPRCEGATIRYCFAGKERSYSCTGVGFEKCVKEGGEVRCGGGGGGG
ncbi:MAG: hypothetical protein ACLQVI_00085 [Polyangiaceae bacterium]